MTQNRSIQQLWTRNTTPFLLFYVVLVYGLWFRLLFYFRFSSQPTKLVTALAESLGTVYREVLFSLFLLLVVLGLSWLFRPRTRAQKPGWLRWTNLFLIHLLLAIIASLYIVHYRLVLSLRTGMTWDMIVELLSTNATGAMLGELLWTDLVLFVFLFAIFWGFKLMSAKVVWYRNAALLGVSLCSFIFMCLPSTGRTALPKAAVSNPLYYTLSDALKSFSARRARAASPKQTVSMKGLYANPNSKSTTYSSKPTLLSSKSAALKRKKNPFLAYHKPRKWNVLFFVLESTGGRYIFTEKYGNEVPMPFLKKLAAKSLYATNHFSNTNTTPRSVFSIFSGLYAAPRIRMFVTRKDVYVPSIIQFLPEDYESFYVYNGSLNWFFPRWFWAHSGMELFGRNRNPMPRSFWKGGPKLGRDERQMMEFFLQRLESAKEPFMSVYHSFVAHWPYPSHGKQYDVFRNKKKLRLPRGLRRYLSNLRLLDTLIEKIYNQLKRTKRLDNTIMVFTGDHGQAFGQHPGNWVHSRSSFNENYHSPLIIYQPKLFKPRVVKKRTLHIDILPTILHAMGVRYNKRLLQGESILTPRPKRKYDFLYGNEQTMTSISRKDIKLQISLKYNICWVYDLKKDPTEQKPLSCSPYKEQKQTLYKYRNYQNRLLYIYNKAHRQRQVTPRARRKVPMPTNLSLSHLWKNESNLVASASGASADDGASAKARRKAVILHRSIRNLTFLNSLNAKRRAVRGRIRRAKERGRTINNEKWQKKQEQLDQKHERVLKAFRSLRAKADKSEKRELLRLKRQARRRRRMCSSPEFASTPICQQGKAAAALGTQRSLPRKKLDIQVGRPVKLSLLQREMMGMSEPSKPGQKKKLDIQVGRPVKLSLAQREMMGMVDPSTLSRRQKLEIQRGRPAKLSLSQKAMMDMSDEPTVSRDQGYANIRIRRRHLSRRGQRGRNGYARTRSWRSASSRRAQPYSRRREFSRGCTWSYSYRCFNRCLSWSQGHCLERSRKRICACIRTRWPRISSRLTFAKGIPLPRKRYISRVVRRRWHKLQQCVRFIPVRSQTPESGNIVIRWKIGNRGFVRDVAARSLSRGMEVINSCIQDQMMEWRFRRVRQGLSSEILCRFRFRSDWQSKHKERPEDRRCARSLRFHCFKRCLERTPFGQCLRRSRILRCGCIPKKSRYSRARFK